MTNRMAIDAQVMQAARELGEAGKRQPEWLWWADGTFGPTFGRWAKSINAAPYIRADIALSASPNAGKVSPDQHHAAMVALQNSKCPYMPAAQRSEIIDIVIAAFGLEKAE